jgi:hypothetical protein
MAQAGLSRFCVPFDGFCAEEAGRLLEEMDDLPITVQQALDARRGEMREQAWETAKRAAELLR